MTVTEKTSARIVERTGQRFGRWTVLRMLERDLWPNRWAWWICRCDCGEERAVSGRNLQANQTRSCGCGRVDMNLRHGHARDSRSLSSEYRCWVEIKRRCYDPTRPAWKYYGGRGITVCERWRASFGAFLADMGPKPSPDLSIDRIDNDGNYEPGNCRWATHLQQRHNSRPRGSCK